MTDLSTWVILDDVIQVTGVQLALDDVVHSGLQIWLAALREMDKDAMEQHIICEDHFLPDDIKKSGVSRDAVPLMPPGMDITSGLMSSWGAESPEEDEQWGAGGCSEDDQEV